jgi:hypothetical protein
VPTIRGRNWERGIDVTRMFDSALRHAFQALAGDQDEDHLAAAVFNLLGLTEYEERATLGLLPASMLEDMGALYAHNKGASE